MEIRSLQGVRWTVSAIALSAALGGITPAFAQIDEIIVQAQKREEALQSVPIAVSAYNEESLDKQQIETFSDLQFTVPNVSFAKSNFGGGANFQIRGIGSAAVATSGDGGVGFHVNDNYILAARIADVEYFDLERVEILRGPQGTLYGRNATGGSVNLITKKPDLNEVQATAEAQYGNFEHKRVKGALNIPLNGVAGVRVSGIWLDRDGYTENTNPAANFDSIDGRDQWALRGSFRVTPLAGTTIDFLYQHFEEDDNRTRGTKQLCDFDASAILGCLPTGLGFGTTNPDATLGGLLVSDLVLGPLALTTFGAGSAATNPADLRQTFLDFNPIYRAEENIYTLSIDQEITPELLFHIQANKQDTSTFSEQDYNNVAAGALGVPALVGVLYPNEYAELFQGGTCLPVSAVDPFNSGVVGGFIRECAEGIQAYDQSTGSAEQTSVEARLSSDFAGPFNFLLGGFWLTFEADSDYYVLANTLDYFSVLADGIDGVSLVTPYFNSETDRYELDTYAFFGEVYYDLMPNLAATLGLRWTHDEKYVKDRQLPLVTGGVSCIAGPAGAACPLPAFDGTAQEAIWLGAGFDADPNTAGQQLFREDNVTFEEFTGRFVLDYMPDLPFTEDTLIYASFSRGYRGGGFNPPFDTTLFPGTSLTFDPEFVNAYEVGTKNTLAGGKVQANITGFYYDYEGLQISKIVNRTSLNENVDAKIWGLEGEFLFAPTPELFFNLNLAYLNTELGEVSSVDTRDPTNGQPNVTLLKALDNTSNCIIEWNGAPDPVGVLPFLVPSPGGTPAGLNPGASAAFSAVGCGTTLAGLLPAPYTTSGGIEANLEGNQLSNSPEFTISAGAQHTYAIANNLTLVSRLDYYWQDDFYTRIFNKEATDLVEAWDVWNANVTLYGPNDKWSIRAFVQNIEDDDNVTGHYLTDPSSGLFTNVFLIDPRLYGVNLTVNF